jgi:hypothetical protein
MLLKQPRMVLTAIGQLGMFEQLAVCASNRNASAKTESLVVVGNWNRDLKGNPDVSNFQVYLVVCVDEHNQPLHDIVGMMNPQPRAGLVSAQAFALTPHAEPEAIVPAPQAAPASYQKTQATLSASEAIDVKSSTVPSVDKGEDPIPF